MAKISRPSVLFSVVALLTGSVVYAQDIAVRTEAFRLMERANAVSRPHRRVPIHKQVITFRAFRLDGTTMDGRTEHIADGDIERWDTTFGSYHAISIHYPQKIVQNQYEPPPPETLEMDSISPIVVGHFDNSDTINSITPATLFGRPAHCVQFETVNGRTHQPANEICFDDELGTLVRRNVGEDLLENTDYVSFEGVLLPRTIRHYINGRLRMELQQEFTLIEDPIDWAALTPPHAVTLTTCYDYKQPARLSTPQPADAGPGPWYDVRIHGVIGNDGRVHEAAVLPAGRSDLEKQAVDLVSTWTFTPASCNGKSTTVNADLVVHFAPQ